MNRFAFLSTAGAFAVAQSPAQTVSFQTYGAYFSKQNGVTPAVDPEVFVRDSSAPGGVGLEAIEHAPGLRALRLGERDVPLYDAAGARLAFTSTKWLAAKGTATISPGSSGGATIALRFSGLINFGLYGVFKTGFGETGTILVPLDAAGARNAFRADPLGGATLTIDARQPESSSAIVLVYRSDAKNFGPQPGKIGWNVHQHLIAPLS